MGKSTCLKAMDKKVELQKVQKELETILANADA